MEENSIAKRISSLRKQKGLTQAELASSINVTDKAISKWENGSGCPDIFNFSLLAKALGTSIDYLITGVNSNTNCININDLYDECVEDGIINISKLISLNNLEYLKKGLKEYPIIEIEKFIKLLKEEDYKSIFRYSVDYGNYKLKSCFVEGNLERLEPLIIKIFWNDLLSYSDINYVVKEINSLNGRYLVDINNKENLFFSKFSEVEDYLEKCRNRIIDDVVGINNFLKEENYNRCYKILEDGYPDEAVVEICKILSDCLNTKYEETYCLENKLSFYLKENDSSDNSYRKESYDDNIKLLFKLIERNNQIEYGSDNGKLLPSEIKKCLNCIFNRKER